MSDLRIIAQEITEELRRAYLDYAMSVIVARALPDVRDGLKPVQRRILYTMKELGLWYREKFTKCANIVGNTIARYHPHGDQAVYDALARMAQEFSLRYPLIHGQGNFGSIDGDPPAAYRYTEAKLSRFAEEMLADIDKETVDYRPNYDNTREEPVILPAKIPNLVINGSLGIAVGMATNIPPHNLIEIMNGIKALVNNRELSIKELLKIIKGPDFPSGGIVYGSEKLIRAYEEGKGGIIVRGEIEVEETRRGKEYLVIKSIPWQVNKSDLVKEIANLALEKVLDEIKEVRDESSREGIRIVIEVKPGADFEKLTREIYRLTSLQKTYYFNFIALENGIQPRIFNLKELLLSWIDHRREVIKRRTKYDLEKNRERVHLLEGFDKALENLDRVINIIKKSRDKSEALEKLINVFKLSEKQADAILEMPLRTLTQMERHKILEELKERRSLIKELEEILRSPKKIDEIIIREADEIINKYPSLRLTKIIETDLDSEKLEKIEEKDVALIISDKNQVYVFETDKIDFEKILRSKQFPQKIYFASTKDNLILVSQRGKIYSLPVYVLYKNPKYLESYLNIEKEDRLVDFTLAKNKYLLVATKRGFIKKMEVDEFNNLRKSGVLAIKLSKDDEVVKILNIKGGEELVVLSKDGNILIFKDNLSIQKRQARGVIAIRGEIIHIESKIGKRMLLVFKRGFLKLFSLEEIKTQSRGGKGLFAFEPEKYGELIFAKILGEEKEIIIRDDKLSKLSINSLPLVKRINAPKKISGIDLVNNVFVF